MINSVILKKTLKHQQTVNTTNQIHIRAYKTENSINTRKISYKAKQQKYIDDPLLNYAPVPYFLKPPKKLFKEFLNGEISGSDLLSQSNSLGSDRKIHLRAQVIKHSKFEVLQSFMKQRMKEKAPTKKDTNITNLTNSNQEQNIYQLSPIRKRLKNQVLLMNKQEPQLIEPDNVNLKTQIYSQCDRLFQCVLKKNENKNLFNKKNKYLYNRIKYPKNNTPYIPMEGSSRNITVQDMKLYNYLHPMQSPTLFQKNDNNQTQFEKYSQHSHQPDKSGHSKRVLHYQHLNSLDDEQEISNISGDQSLQSLYELHIDELYKRQRKVQDRYSKSTKRFDQTLKTLTLLKNITQESYETNKKKLHQN